MLNFTGDFCWIYPFSQNSRRRINRVLLQCSSFQNNPRADVEDGDQKKCFLWHQGSLRVLSCLTLLLSWLKTLHGYPNAIYENLGTSVHADLMVWGEINLLNKGGLKMNLAFLISFMTFHFYLNLAFHTNIFTIRIVIVIYFNFFKKKNID